ncbi:response regulator transcription factor [Bifidobacterium callitrichos]|uniref:Winged helix family two component transcriptional regulator n=1 Tax=Bifidobacterium callitrichos DSM 23973 TaxID=1437609 RepID=A0A087A257_9BIFI|nr:response regulator transcription factor [Bifidobacterium callitrichos]KFI52857.1 winged helix family two component transcriptional regulator [Bifidobacterium callitrichos DSM 23973]
MRLLVAVGNTALSHAIQGTLSNARYTVTAIDPKSLVSPALASETVISVLREHASDPDERPFDIAILGSTDLVAAAKSAQPSIRTLLLATTTLRGTAADAARMASARANAALDSTGDEDGHPSDQSSDQPIATAKPDATLRLPFSDTELLSYVELLARDSAGAGPETMMIRGDLTLDLTSRKAYFASTHKAMPLSRLEFDILETLVRARGRFVGLDELQHSAGGSYFTQEGLVRRGVESLDRKLRNAGLALTKRDDWYRVL